MTTKEEPNLAELLAKYIQKGTYTPTYEPTNSKYNIGLTHDSTCEELHSLSQKELIWYVKHNKDDIYYIDKQPFEEKFKIMSLYTKGFTTDTKKLIQKYTHKPLEYGANTMDAFDVDIIELFAKV